MNIASALLKQVLASQDFETWSSTKKHYLPTEYHLVYSVIYNHCSKFHKLPTFEDLKFEIRDGQTLEKVHAIESVQTEVSAASLLEYLKDSYAQKEILNSLETYIDQSIAFQDAQESLDSLHSIIMDVESKIDLQPSSENMARINLFEADEDLERYIALGLNTEYDQSIKFAPDDYILFGGRRGAGKSITCANIAHNAYAAGKSALYFTIEMNSRSILQRCCAIGSGVPFSRLRTKNLSQQEWNKVAIWWANRFEGSEPLLKNYALHHDFNKFHKELVTTCQLVPEHQLDIIYDAQLTLPRIEVELSKKVKQLNVGVIVIDYINQVRRSSTPSFKGQYDWTEQLEVSKAFKMFAQEYQVPVVSAYQIDASGEARFSKAILDSVDGAFVLDPYTHEDARIKFECVKMRNAPEDSFISTMDWNTLKMGPESADEPTEESDSKKTGESIYEK